MSAVSVQVICYKYKTLKDGTAPLMVRICKAGKRKYVSLGISVDPKHWDFQKNRPRRNCPYRDLLMQVITLKQHEYKEAVLNLESRNRDYTSAAVASQANQPKKPTTVGEMYERLISDFRRKDQLGTARIYVNSRESVKKFCRGSLDFSFAEIDVEWLTRYEDWLREFCMDTTMSMLFRTLRSVYNKAITQKVVRADNYPFREYKVSHFNTKTKKRAIRKDDIVRIRELILPDNRPDLSLARDFFVFSFYGAGINFTDMAYLTYSNIDEGHIRYTRKKTHREIVFPINPYCQAILDRYYKAEAAPDDYIFPVLDRHVHLTEQQRVNRIHKILGKTDRALKVIGKMLDIPRLTTYVARHSFATVMKRAGVNIAIISESLGHASLSTTQIYLDTFETSQIDEAMSCLL